MAVAVVGSGTPEARKGCAVRKVVVIAVLNGIGTAVALTLPLRPGFTVDDDAAPPTGIG